MTARVKKPAGWLLFLTPLAPVGLVQAALDIGAARYGRALVLIGVALALVATTLWRLRRAGQRGDVKRRLVVFGLVIVGLTAALVAPCAVDILTDRIVEQAYGPMPAAKARIREEEANEVARVEMRLFMLGVVVVPVGVFLATRRRRHDAIR
jgi:hypothetical protein